MAGRDVRFDIIAQDKASTTLKKVGRAAEDAGEGFDQLGESVDDAGGKVGKIGDVMKGAVGVVAAAGAVIGGALMAGIGEAMERDALQTRLASQLGLAGDEAERYGRLSGELYADAYGESIGQVNEAISGVYRNIGKGNDEWTKDITGKVLSVADVFEQDLGMTTAAVGQLMRNGLAKDADEALDIITTGLQNGANKADDLLETFNEYGTKFRDLGIDGKQALLLMSQGLQAGARDADIVADALKEFSIRAIDGSEATEAGFMRIGLKSADMARKIAKGGDTAAEALDLTLDSLRSIEDPVERNAAAVELFGTQAEDLGDALFSLDLDGTATGMDNVSGAAKRLDKDMGSTLQARFESFKRTGVDALVTSLQRMLDKWDEIQPKLQPVYDAFTDIGDWMTGAFQPAMDDAVNQYLPAFQQGIDDITAAFGDSTGDGAQFGDAIKAVGDVLIFFARNTIRTWAGIALVIGTTVKSAKWGFDNIMKPSLRSLWDVVDFVFGGIVDAAAAAFGWIPGIGPRLKEAQRQFRAFRDKVNAALDGIHDRYVNVNVRTVYSGGENYSQKESTNGRGGRATGGGMMVGASYAVNERGQEMLKLNDRSAAVIPHAQSQRMLRAGGGGGGEVHSHFHLSGIIAPDRQSAARMLRSLMREAEMSGVAG